MKAEKVEAYTPSQIWSILMGESENPDDYFDVEMGLAAMKEPQRLFLLRLAMGISGAEAMRLSGLKGVSTRHKKAAIEELTRLINGEDKSVENIR